MADSRKARREADPGLQPERTSLAWLRTLLGYGALIALAIKHNWHRTGAVLDLACCAGAGGNRFMALYPQP